MGVMKLRPDVLAGAKLQENCAVGGLLGPGYRLILQNRVNQMNASVIMEKATAAPDLRGRVHRRGDRACGRRRRGARWRSVNAMQDFGRFARACEQILRVFLKY